MKLFFILNILLIPSFALGHWAKREELPYVVKKMDLSIKVKKEGTYSLTVQKDFELSKSAGINQFKNLILTHHSPRSELKVVSATVRGVNGEKPIDLTNLKSQEVMGNKFQVLKIPEVELGSRLVVKYHEVVPQFVSNHFSTAIFLGERELIEELDIKILSEIKLHLRLNDPFELIAKSDEEGKKIYKHILKSKKPLDRFVLGENTFLGKESLTFIELSSETDWQKVSKFMLTWFKELETGLSDKSISETMKKIKGMKTKSEKVTSLHELISGITLKQNSGFESIQKAKLLKELLTVEGIKSDLLLMDISRLAGLFELPNVESLNYPLLKVYLDTGPVWINVVNPLSAITGISEKNAIDISQDGKVQTISFEDSASQKITINKNIDFSQPENVLIKVQGRFEGFLASVLVKQQNEKSEKLHEGLKLLYKDFETPSEQLIEVEKNSSIQQFTFNASYRSTDAVKRNSSSYRYKLPNLDPYFQSLYLNPQTTAGNLYLGNKSEYHRVVNLNGIYPSNMPLGCNVESKWVSASRVFKRVEKGVHLEHKIKILSPLIKNAELKSSAFAEIQALLRSCMGYFAVDFTSSAKKHPPTLDEIESRLSKLSVEERVKTRYEIAKSAIRGESKEEIGFGAAVPLLRKNIQESPKHIESYRLLARNVLYSNQKGYIRRTIEESLGIIKEGQKHSPTDLGLRVAEAIMNYNLGNLKESYRIVSEIKPHEQLTEFREATFLKTIYLSMKDAKKAEDVLVSALKKFTNQYERIQLYSSLQDTYEITNQWEKCVQMYKALPKDLDGKVSQHYKYVNCLAKAKKFDEAVSVALQTHQDWEGNKCPSLAWIFDERGRHNLGIGKYDEAYNDYKKSIEWGSDYSSTYIGLAKIAIFKKDIQTAKDNFKKGLQVFKGNSINYYFHHGEMFKNFPDDYLELMSEAISRIEPGAGKMNAYYQTAIHFLNLRHSKQFFLISDEAILFGEKYVQVPGVRNQLTYLLLISGSQKGDKAILVKGIEMGKKLKQEDPTNKFLETTLASAEKRLKSLNAKTEN